MSEKMHWWAVSGISETPEGYSNNLEIYYVSSEQEAIGSFFLDVSKTVPSAKIYSVLAVPVVANKGSD